MAAIQSGARRSEKRARAGAGDRETDAYERLMGELETGIIRPTYLLFGDEVFLLQNAIYRIRALVIEPSAAALDEQLLDGRGGRGVNWCEIASMLKTPPFLSRKRMLLLRGSGAVKNAAPTDRDQQEAFFSCISRESDDACLILWEDQVDRRIKKPLQAVAKHGMVAEFKALSSMKLLNWIAAYFAQENIRISRSAAENLLSRCDASLLILSNECRKLKLYALGAQISELHLSDIERVARPDLQGSIFNLLDAVAVGNAADALTIYQILQQNREANIKILFMIARQVRQLLCAKSAGQADQLGMALTLQPFVLKRLISQSKAFSMDRLKHMYQLCRERDRQIKSGQMSETLALETLIMSLCQT